MRSGISLSRLCLLAFLACVAPAAAQVLAPNLIYTSVQPCRVFDTRFATNGTNGRLIHGVAQTFNVVGGNVISTTFTGQGGHSGGCALPGFDTTPAPQVQAVVFNFVAVGSAGGGDIVAWPSDQAQPNASIINYANSANLGFLNIANGIVVPVRQDSQGADVTLKAQVSDTDVLADVVGYFSSVSAVQGSGIANLFLGKGAGNPSASSGGSNTAVGFRALSANLIGSFNTAFGDDALLNAVTDGSTTQNTAVGADALRADTTGGFNMAIGSAALLSNTTGGANTAAGDSALRFNTGGAQNAALGTNALINLLTGSNNVGVGAFAGDLYTGAEGNDIVIGNEGIAGESGVIRIGTVGTQTQTFIAGINGATSSGGTAVFVNASGQLGTTTSSRRFKEDVADMGEASDGLMRLRPVTFHYKAAYDDGSRLLQYGLIAEEVAAIYPDLVQYDQEGQPQAVRYHFVNAMLLNEVQRQHGRIAALEAEIAGQRAENASQRARIEDGQRRAAAQESRLQALEARLARLEAGEKAKVDKN